MGRRFIFVAALSTTLKWIGYTTLFLWRNTIITINVIFTICQAEEEPSEWKKKWLFDAKLSYCYLSSARIAWEICQFWYFVRSCLFTSPPHLSEKFVFSFQECLVHSLVFSKFVMMCVLLINAVCRIHQVCSFVPLFQWEGILFCIWEVFWFLSGKSNANLLIKTSKKEMIFCLDVLMYIWQKDKTVWKSKAS